MPEHETLLFPVFSYLRRHGVPIGVSEYLAAVQTLRAGFGLEDIEQLKRLCAILWVKSVDDRELLEVAFSELASPVFARRPQEEATQTPDSQLNENEIDDPDVDVPDVEDETGLLLDGEAEEEDVDAQTFGSTGLRDRMVERQQLAPVQAPPLGRRYYMVQQPRYHLTPRPPLTLRTISAAWRHLRQLRREGVADELDVEGTIEDIGAKGLILEPRMQPRRQNVARLMVLIDQFGSMSPFKPHIDLLREGILRGGLLGHVSQYYFHDVPSPHLYSRPGLFRATLTERVLSAEAVDYSALIVSDAGAARGHYDEGRVEATKEFLRSLYSHTHRFAWLNPMPPDRWANTTAEGIARHVPMFHLDREGLNDAINILKGRTFPPGVTIP